MRRVTLAAVQFSCGWDRQENVAKADRLVREAAGQGANVIVLQELFETPYFCAVQRPSFMELARPLEGHPTIEHFQALARELGVVLPVSVFELAGAAAFNAVVVIDADGRRVGHYRKSHIPQAPGYEEKYYFSPGDTGFKPIDTAFGRLGIGICWDQWFPETARCLALQGADFLLYPTAIGSEPGEPTLDSMEHWRIVMRGHAGANMLPLVASNRIGVESTDGVEMSFYGSSFIADHLGALVASADRSAEGVLVASFDLDECLAYRRAWGSFRDRRPALYGAIATLDGGLTSKS
jgi:N-carbamoylputrescine amidase